MALRRGIAGYANGTSNVMHYQDGTDNVPPPIAQDPGASPWGGGAPVQPATPSGLSQLLGGQFPAAQQNPQASLATKALAGVAEQAGRAQAASRLASPPSILEHVLNFFTGNDQTSADIARRQQTANALGDPLVQQGLVAHPDRLLEAQQNPDAFADQTQNPEFMKTLTDGIANHATMSQPVIVGDGAGNQRPVQVKDPAVAAKAMTDHGVPADAAVALTHGHQLSREEFINSLINTPTKVIQMLFGAQLGHVPTVHDAVAKTYFDAMGQSLAKERAAIAEMEQRGDKREAADIKKRKATLEANEQLYSTQMGAYVGGYQRQYPMNLPPP